MKSRGMVCLLLMAFGLSSISYAAQSDRIQGALAGPIVALAGNVHRLALPQFDQGGVDPALQLGTITLMTAPTIAQQQALKQLLAQQQDPRSSNYHKWLTPEQFADRFGLSQNDIQQIAAWLESEGFTNVHPARGRNWVSFTGTAAQVESALRTSIHHYNVNGTMHYANATAPMIPQALAGIVTGFRGLTDFKPHPMNKKRTRPYYSSSSVGDVIAPGDIATIYDITPLYNSGVDGTGQKLAVMGQTEIYLADLNDFRSGFGLSALSCTVDGTGLITACNDPHFKYVLDGSSILSHNGDVSEADLDLEWSGAVAKGAQIIYVNSTDTFTSYYYAVDNDIAPVISLSYGFCEFDDNHVLSTTGQPLADEMELQKANAEGITFVNSSGDSGAAECDSSSETIATGGLALSYPASSPEVTGAGGTGIVFADWTSPTYWGTTNGANGGSALSYVPEQTWNDDYEIYQFCQQNSSSFCTQGGPTKQPGWVSITSEATAQSDIGISSTGGGASNCAIQNANNSACVSGFPKPSWQTVTVSGTSTRLSPDISFFASPNFPGYIFCTELSELGDGGTGSTCAPGGSAGITNALALANPSIIGGTSASAPVFAGMVALLNQSTGSSGQGNINPTLYQVAAAAPSAFHDVTAADNKVSCQPGTPAGQPTALLCPSSGVIGYSASAGFDLTTGLGSIDLNNFVDALAATNGATYSLQSNLSGGTLTIAQGQIGNINLTVSSTSTPSFIVPNGSGGQQTALPVSYSCTGLPSGAVCNFSPFPTTQDVTLTLALSTSAPTAKLENPLDRGGRLFYAVLLPGMLGVFFTLVPRKRSLSGMRALGLIIVLGVSTLWMGSCGGNSSTPKNLGTPTGSYPITINATTGGSTPITASLPFTLTVTP